MSTKPKEKKNKVGKKSRYIVLDIDKRLAEIEQWRREGFTEEQIFKKLNISATSGYKYKNEYPQFAEALKHSKQTLAADISKSIFKRTLATERTVVKKKWIYKENEKTGKMDKILVSHIEETTPREVTAQDIKVAKFLMNEWRKIEEIQIDKTIKLPNVAMASDQKVLDFLGITGEDEDEDQETDDDDGDDDEG